MKETIPYSNSNYQEKDNQDRKKDIIIVDKNGTGDYTSIQEAINNSYDHQTIVVKQGV
ncbi:MAG: hypothetical protein GX066_09420, partial [Clostridiaceae bacterium]|nr:hypothetical protein [Clostridiaceae bacterium]